MVKFKLTLGVLALSSSYAVEAQPLRSPQPQDIQLAGQSGTPLTPRFLATDLAMKSPVGENPAISDIQKRTNPTDYLTKSKVQREFEAKVQAARDKEATREDAYNQAFNRLERTQRSLARYEQLYEQNGEHYTTDPERQRQDLNRITHYRANIEKQKGELETARQAWARASQSRLALTEPLPAA